MPYKDPEKQKQAQRQHYLNNKQTYVNRAQNRNRNAYKRLIEIKESTPCVDCKVQYPHYVMDFDHTGTDKIADVSKIWKLKAWETVLAEIAKCELVCANCHRIRTWNRHQIQPLVD